MRIFRGIGVLALCLSATMALPTPNENEAALRAVSTGAGEFSTSLYKSIAESTPGNLIVSPLSADLVLSMAAYGARQNTATQMRSGLHMPEDDNLGKSGYKNLIDVLNDVKDVDLRLANKVYTHKDFNVKPEFMQLTQDSFHSVSEQIDFSQQQAAADNINKWAMDHTNNKIKDLVKAGDLDVTTRMVLLNAVYFKGKWEVPFDAKDTAPMPFHVDENTVKDVPTMYRKGDFKYGDLPDLKATFIVIPYTGGNMSMFILLPNEVNGLAEVEKNLDKLNIQETIKNSYPREVRLFLPKFKIESKIDMKAPLEKLGMTEMFTDHADFSGIADVPLKVGKVMQKAFIEVNEEGSEAAAVTEMEIMLMSIPLPPPVAAVNRPFVYAIVKHDADAILFQGHVHEPTL